PQESPRPRAASVVFEYRHRFPLPTNTKPRTEAVERHHPAPREIIGAAPPGIAVTRPMADRRLNPARSPLLTSWCRFILDRFAGRGGSDFNIFFSPNRNCRDKTI